MSHPTTLQKDPNVQNETSEPLDNGRSNFPQEQLARASPHFFFCFLPAGEPDKHTSPTHDRNITEPTARFVHAKTAPEQGAMLREASRREHRQNRKTRFGKTRPCEGRLPRPLATPCDRHLLCIPSAGAGPPKAKRRSAETCKDQIWDSETCSGQEFRIKPKRSVRLVARPHSANHSEQPPNHIWNGRPSLNKRGAVGGIISGDM